jgi:hypothetical protein
MYITTSVWDVSQPENRVLLWPTQSRQHRAEDGLAVGFQNTAKITRFADKGEL